MLTTSPHAVQDTRDHAPLRDRSPGDPLEMVVDHMRRHPRIDGGAFLLVDRERTRLTPATSWFASPLLAKAMATVLSRPYLRHTPGVGEAALERGRPLFLPRVDDWQAADSLREVLGRAGGELARELWTAFAGASVIACPVRNSVGQAVGVLEVMSFDSQRPLLADDLQTAELIADLAALAHQRHTWLTQETARARTELQLKRAAADVSGSLETPEVLRHVVEHAVRATAADHALISRLLPSGELEEAAATPARGECSFSFAHIADVARTHKTRIHDDPAPSVHVPVALGGRLYGVLSVGTGVARPFGEDDVEMLQRLARASAASILNAAHFEQERRVARALTRGFVPDDLEAHDDYEVAALYRPSEGQIAGGDLYGAWRRPGGDLALLIGDVAGKGAGASGLSAMTRFFVEAQSWDGAGPAAVLERVSRMLTERLPDEMFVTAFLAVVEGDRLRCANAGHLRPLLLRAGRPLEALECGGLPLGVDSAWEYEETALDLDSGDSLYGYTDGLTEARRGNRLLGTDHLLQLVEDERARGGRLEDLVGAVHEAVRSWSDGLADDSTALALRRR